MDAVMVDNVWAIPAGEWPTASLAAAAARTNWPVIRRDPLGSLLRRVLHAKPALAVVEVDRTPAALRVLDALRSRQVGLVALEAEAAIDDADALERAVRTVGVLAYLRHNAAERDLLDAVAAVRAAGGWSEHAGARYAPSATQTMERARVALQRQPLAIGAGATLVPRWRG